MNNVVFDCTAYRDAYTGQVVYHTSKRPTNNYFQYRRILNDLFYLCNVYL